MGMFRLRDVCLQELRTDRKESRCPGADLVIDRGAILSYISNHELGTCSTNSSQIATGSNLSQLPDI